MINTSTFGWRSVVRNLQTLLPNGLHERRLDLQQWVQRRSGRPHETEFRSLGGLLQPGAHVLDVGANRGQSIDSIRSLGIPVRITAFEPQRELARRLTGRYRGVDVRQVALGDDHAEMKLYTPSYRGYRFDGLASTDYETAVSWFSYAIWPYRAELVTVDTEQITVLPLDSCDDVAPVDFIKIDAQGMEQAVLQGGRGVLERDRPLLMLETPDAATVGWLVDLGYQSIDIDGSSAGAWPGNTLFCHLDSAAARSPRMTDGTVYFDSASRSQRVFRDPSVKRNPVQRARLLVTDSLRDETSQR